ncbi:MAG: OsmC family protein [Chthoniobacterales bacterium]
MSEAAAASSPNHLAHADVVVRGNPGAFLQKITVGKHHLEADEPFSIGGNDSAPDPYDYLLAGLGACTSMTIGLYARRSKWPLDDIVVTLRHSRMHVSDCTDCDTQTGMLDCIEVEIELVGEITPEQRAKLMQIAHKCPVHRTLKGEIKIDVRAAEST